MKIRSALLSAVILQMLASPVAAKESNSANAKSWYLSLDVYPHCNTGMCLTVALLSTSPKKDATPAYWEGGFKTRDECLAVSRWVERRVGIGSPAGGAGIAKIIGRCQYLKNQPRPASDDKDGFMISQKDQQENEFSMQEALRIPNVVKPRSKSCSGTFDDLPFAIPAAKCWFLSFTVHGYCSSDDCPEPWNEKWLKDQIKMTWEGGFETHNKCLAIIDKIQQRHEIRMWIGVVYAIDKITNVRCQYIRNQPWDNPIKKKGDYQLFAKEQWQFFEKERP
jgi:hypothetical protein